MSSAVPITPSAPGFRLAKVARVRAMKLVGLPGTKRGSSGARGMITLPWAWGWPVNAVNLFRARHYMTTWANLDRPWRGLEARGARLRLVHRALWGTAYVAVGRMPGGPRG